MTKSPKDLTLQALLILTFVSLALLIFVILNASRTTTQQQHLQTATERYHLAYNTIYSQYKKLAQTLHSGLKDRFAVQDIYLQLVNADDNEKNRLRQELFNAINPRYLELQKQTGIRQLQFHLPNNDSFLRLHHPERFGDNLSTVRETVSFVNREHIPIDGFEIGRYCAGYRFVFPITGEDQSHLGSMELSFGPEILTSAMMEQYSVLSNFFISEKHYLDKHFPSDDKTSLTPSPHKGMLHDTNVLANLEQINSNLPPKLHPKVSTIQAVCNNVKSDINTSYYGSFIDKTITTLPVFNPVTTQKVAVLTVRSQSDFFIKEKQHFQIIFGMSMLLLLTLFSIFTLQYNKRKALESSTRQLKKQKQRLLFAQEIANVGDWEHDHTSNTLSWSQQIYQILEVDPDQFPPTYEAFLERVHPDDRYFVSSSYQNSIDDHQPYDIKHRILTRDSSEKWVREICSTTYDTNGSPICSRGTMHDITKQHNALITLQQERDMFMDGPVMTFTWLNSQDWPVTQVSANVAGLLGYSTEEFLNHSILYSACIHPDDLQRVTVEVTHNSSPGNGCFLHEPYRLIHRNGRAIWVLDCTSLVLDDKGTITHYQGYLVDITKMKKMEKEVQTSKIRLRIQQQEEESKRCESLKTMAGAIAHRFNNAMTAVQGNLDLITLTTDKKSNEFRMATNASQAAKGASQIGSMMLSYAGQHPLYLHEASLFELVRESIDTLGILQRSSISLELIPPPQPLTCAIDREQITNVFTSVLNNAVEALNNEEGTVQISFGNDYFTRDAFPASFYGDSLKDGMYNFCQITDSGHGIDADEISRIFEPFFTTHFVGRGLGLALTVGIMRSHSGAITVESTPDIGTKVKVLLPSIPDEPQVDRKHMPNKLKHSGHILLAEDEILILQVGKDILNSLGYTVHTAVNGRDAVELVRKQSIQFCAVVLDISMPELDGIEAMKAIRKIVPSLPVLLSSGYSKNKFCFTEDQGNIPDGFLPKPFRRADMKSSLEKLLA